MSLMQAISGQNYSLFHTRCFEHNGCILDIGCATWNWSSIFIGKKRVIGVDPFEKSTPGTEIFNGLLGPFNGISWLYYEGFNSKVVGNDVLNYNSSLFNVLNYKEFCSKYNVDKVSILKMNIEGAEYSLLNSMDVNDFEKIDQIIISFHNWMNPLWDNLTLSSKYLLEKSGFELQTIDPTYNWVLGLKKY